MCETVWDNSLLLHLCPKPLTCISVIPFDLRAYWKNDTAFSLQLEFTLYKNGIIILEEGLLKGRGIHVTPWKRVDLVLSVGQSPSTAQTLYLDHFTSYKPRSASAERNIPSLENYNNHGKLHMGKEYINKRVPYLHPKVYWNMKNSRLSHMLWDFCQEYLLLEVEWCCA